VRHWTLLPLNAHDSVAAPRLLPLLAGGGGGGGYVVGDNAYDTNECHALATATNHRLVAPRACNRGVRDAANNLPQRLRALDMLDCPLRATGQGGSGPSPFGRDLYNYRQRIESGFGRLTFAGLGALPPWERRPRRVALWTAGKILLYLTKCAADQRLIA
jgi:hypothetical protein